MNPPILRLSGLLRRFGSFEALRGLNLEIQAGELFTLLGPSGCGKTTTLRLIAGLEEPDGGEIWFDGQKIVDAMNRVAVPPHRRNMGMVFQSYAIWPHMTVFENVAYPLRARGSPRKEITLLVSNALEKVGLSGYEDRPAPALSGGQQQRVAIARAIVYEPKLLLLDEPFSNLDSKLREQMRGEIRKLLKGLGVTVLLVTHDQLEALGMSDRIAVMNCGSIEQIGNPTEVYDNPENPFVRDFLGRVVLLRGSITGFTPDGCIDVVLTHRSSASTAPRFQLPSAERSTLTIGQDVTLAIRPEEIDVTPLSRRTSSLPLEEGSAPGTIESLMFAGDRYEARIRTADSIFVGYVAKGQPWYEGQEVVLRFPAKELSLWPS